MLLHRKLMQESHGTNDIIIALAVIMMTPKHQTNLIFLPRWALSVSCAGHIFFHSWFMFMFLQIYNRELPCGLICCSQSVLYWTVASWILFPNVFLFWVGYSGRISSYIPERKLWDAFTAVGLEKGRMLERSYPSAVTKEEHVALPIFWTGVCHWDYVAG